jgi:TrmH family RNA methyltransferase
MKHISSRQHPLVAACRALAQQPDRSGRRLLLDGEHLVEEGRAAKLTFEMVAVVEAHLASDSAEGQAARALADAGVNVVTTSQSVLEAMSPVRTPSGIVAIVERPAVSVDEICGVANAFVLALVDVQDPGNLGALVRVAEAGGVTGVLVCGTSASPFSWKAVRGSMGSVLRMPIASGGAPRDLLGATKEAGLRSVAAVARGGQSPAAIAWDGPLALWLGGEGPGLDQAFTGACDASVTIPMTPPVESLNVAVAGGILVYAARRA